MHMYWGLQRWATEPKETLTMKEQAEKEEMGAIRKEAHGRG